MKFFSFQPSNLSRFGTYSLRTTEGSKESSEDDILSALVLFSGSNESRSTLRFRLAD
jgi:hypothetical protein